jgi:hypothetical protein
VTRPVILAAVSAALLASGCSKFKDLMSPPMAEFTSPDGTWKAKFPGKPSEKTKSAFGVAFTMWVKEPWGSKGGYMVGTAELPIPTNESDAMIQKRLDDGVAGSVGGVGGTLTDSKRILWHGRYPGRELTATITEPKAGIYKCRMYVVGKKMYMAAAMGEESFVSAPRAEEFLDSFALVGESAPAHAPGGVSNPAERLAMAPPKPRPAERVTPRPVETDPIPKATGVAIHSTNGKFKAHFPESPTKATAKSGEVTFTTYAATANAAGYAAGYADRPELDGAAGKARQGALDAARDATVADLGEDAKMGKCELLVLAGRHRGWEFAGSSGDQMVRGRVYLVGTRLYRVTVRGPADTVKGPGADAFLESFQVVN